MWRIYYYPNNGMIKYQINIEAASQMEPMPFVDFIDKQNIEGRKIDLNSKSLVDAPQPPAVSPAFNNASRFVFKSIDAAKKNFS